MQGQVHLSSSSHQRYGGIFLFFDFWGPNEVTSKGVFQYFMMVSDDYSRKIWVYLLKPKSEAVGTFKQFKRFYNEEPL